VTRVRFTTKLSFSTGPQSILPAIFQLQNLHCIASAN